MGHDHGHAARHRGRGQRRRLAVVLGLTLAVLVAEVVGAVLTGSLALLADAGHMATDAVGIALALAAVTLAQRPARGRRTFGWQRVEILAAVANGLLLLAVAGYVLVEAVRRIGNPPEIASGLMLVVGVRRPGRQPRVARRPAPGAGGVAQRARRLPRGAGRRARLGGGHRRRRSSSPSPAGRPPTPSPRWSSACLVLPRAWHLLREALDVLLEAAPRGVDLGRVRAHILGVDGVVGVHDLHAWTITSGLPVLSAHVVVTDEALAPGTAAGCSTRSASASGAHFDVEHCTFQLERRCARRPRGARPRLKEDPAASPPLARSRRDPAAGPLQHVPGGTVERA